ncbi:22182_t:CDS:2, partial [Racocetra persica]
RIEMSKFNPLYTILVTVIEGRYFTQKPNSKLYAECRFIFRKTNFYNFITGQEYNQTYQSYNTTVTNIDTSRVIDADSSLHYQYLHLSKFQK